MTIGYVVIILVLPARDSKFNFRRRYGGVERVEVPNCGHGQALDQFLFNVNFSTMFSHYSWSIFGLKISPFAWKKETKAPNSCVCWHTSSELSARSIPVGEAGWAALETFHGVVEERDRTLCASLESTDGSFAPYFCLTIGRWKQSLSEVVGSRMLDFKLMRH